MILGAEARPGRDAGDDGRVLRARRGGRRIRGNAMARASRAPCAAAAMEALAALRRPPPDEPPPNYPVWPLWYAALAFVHVRQTGALLVLGLAIGAVLKVL